MGELAQSLGWQRNEAELVTELQAGSELAFDYLVTYYHNSVYNLVYGILADAADAADVTQEVFLRVFRGIRGFRRSSSLKTWIYRVAVRQALNQRRWCWRHHRQQISIEAEEEANHSIFELRDNEATPFEQLATQEVQTAVRQALAAVPAPFRSAVILRDLEGLSYEEVAEVLDVSVGTIKSRILRGRRMLKKLLDPLLRVRTAETAGQGGRDAAVGAGQRSSHVAAGQSGSGNSWRRDAQRPFEIISAEALPSAGAEFAGAEEAGK